MKTPILAVLGASLLAWPTWPRRRTKSAADGIAEYRKMLEDGNPADLFEAKGEDLWKQARGPKNASLERAIWARARVWSRVPSLNCRATLPTRARCRTWNRAW
jgi:hypothetical protein